MRSLHLLSTRLPSSHLCIVRLGGRALLFQDSVLIEFSASNGLILETEEGIF